MKKKRRDEFISTLQGCWLSGWQGLSELSGFLSPAVFLKAEGNGFL